MSLSECLTWPKGWRTGLSPCRCPVWCRHCCHMTLPGQCNWAGRRWERRGCGSRLLTGWHLSPGLLPGDRTREHLRERKRRKRSWKQLKVSELNATRQLPHSQFLISKNTCKSKSERWIRSRDLQWRRQPLFCWAEILARWLAYFSPLQSSIAALRYFLLSFFYRPNFIWSHQSFTPYN